LSFLYVSARYAYTNTPRTFLYELVLELLGAAAPAMTNSPGILKPLPTRHSSMEFT
jgi:hypothetical protein